MITSLKRTNDPTTWLAVTRVEMEKQLSISTDFEGSRTDGIIEASVQEVESDTEQSITATAQAQDQEWTMKLDRWPTNDQAAIYLPKGPVESIVSFAYLNSAGTSTPLVADTDYKFNNNDDQPFLTYIGSWPSLYSTDFREKITVVYETGYTTVPSWAKEAIKAYGTEIYSAGEVSTTKIYESLTKKHRLYFDWKINE